MTKFAFIVPPLTGHVNPTLSVGRKLIERGHHVTWVALHQFEIPEGGNFILLKEVETRKAEVDIILQSAKRGSTISSALASIPFVYNDILIPLAKIMIDGVMRVLDDIQPDIIISDEHAFAGGMAAYKKQIPYLTFRTIPADTTDLAYQNVSSWISSQMKKLQQGCDINTEDEIVTSTQLIIIFSSYKFTGKFNFPSHYKFVGPAIDERPESASPDWLRTLEKDAINILVSVGTIERSDKGLFFSAVVEALKDEPISVIAVADPDLLPQWPANFIVKTRIPQLALLPFLRGVVCHGGHNTVCEALFFGIPLIVMPMAFDQYHVASQVVQSGAGLRLKFKRIDVNQLRDAVRAIIENPEFRVAAENISTSFQEAGGANAAADYIEEFSLEFSRQ